MVYEFYILWLIKTIEILLNVNIRETHHIAARGGGLSMLKSNTFLSHSQRIILFETLKSLAINLFAYLSLPST